MKLQQVVSAQKLAVKFGEWSQDKIRAKDFPLSKKSGGRTYPLTQRYRWQVGRFEANGRTFRVLIAYHTVVPEYCAVLAEDIGGDSCIIARLEWHQSHPGWHLHPVCGDFDGCTAGIVKPMGTRRLPEAKKDHRRKIFLNTGHVMGDAVATAVACECFGIPFDKELYVHGALPW